MDNPEKITAHWLAWFLVGALAGGCATSSMVHREDGPGDGATAKQSPDESNYRNIAEKLLEHLNERRKSGTDIAQAAGKDGIYPVYECMDHGCPDRVFCEEPGAYCHVTHCGQKQCSFCPREFPDIFKNLVFKQWCQFDCLRGSTRAGVAFGFVPSIGNVFIGPYCLKE